MEVEGRRVGNGGTASAGTAIIGRTHCTDKKWIIVGVTIVGKDGDSDRCILVCAANIVHGHGRDVVDADPHRTAVIAGVAIS